MTESTPTPDGAIRQSEESRTRLLRFQMLYGEEVGTVYLEVRSIWKETVGDEKFPPDEEARGKRDKYESRLQTAKEIFLVSVASAIGDLDYTVRLGAIKAFHDFCVRDSKRPSRVMPDPYYE
jgi:hypothetical protein